ncbi:MAG: hypothetical protein ACJAUP_001416 [Cellvibrionaceae bacterium]
MTIFGFTVPASIGVIGGEYSIDGNIFTDVPSIINNGQTVCLRITSDDFYDGERSVILFVAYVADTFSFRTAPPDLTPEPFSFDGQIDVIIDSVVFSNTVMVSGINDPTPISVEGGEYFLNNGDDFQSTPFSVNNNQTVLLRQATSTTNSTQKDTILTVGDFSATFSTTTASNQVPIATDINITDENRDDAAAGEFLTGNYIFFDADGYLGVAVHFAG